MATNEVYSNTRFLPLPVPVGTVSGAPVVVGDIPGVATTDRGADGVATVDTDAAYLLTVTGAVSVVGTIIYAVLDGSNVVTSLTTTASGNKRFGYALATQAATGKLTVMLGY